MPSITIRYSADIEVNLINNISTLIFSHTMSEVWNFNSAMGSELSFLYEIPEEKKRAKMKSRVTINSDYRTFAGMTDMKAYRMLEKNDYIVFFLDEFIKITMNILRGKY